MVKIQKIIIHALIGLTLVSLSLSQRCSDNCYHCEGNGICSLCYKRHLLKNSDGRPAICSSDPQPASDGCLIYLGARFCYQCKPGWAWGYKNYYSYCAKSTIQNCAIEKIKSNGKHTCSDCFGVIRAVMGPNASPPASSITRFIGVWSGSLLLGCSCVASVRMGIPVYMISVSRLQLPWRVAYWLRTENAVFVTERMGTL